MRNFSQANVIASLSFAPYWAAGQSFDELLKTVIQGDAVAVAGFLDRGLDPNTADLQGISILMTAAREGHQDLVALLIDRKASVIRRSPHGDTALMLASLKGHLGIVKLLVDRGAELSNSGWQPIHYAAFEGRAEVLKYLLEKGANKNSLAPNGYTPLMLTARGGHFVAAETLLRADADFTYKGPNNETALGIAKERKFADVEALLKRAGAVD